MQRSRAMLLAISILTFGLSTSGQGQMASQFDWRLIQGGSFLPEIKNQGECGSCVAFAITDALQMQASIHYDQPESGWQLSAQQLFSCGGGKCRNGWQLSQAVQYVEEKGVADASCLPYLSGSEGKDIPCGRACPDVEQRSLKIKKARQISRGYVDQLAIKRALQHGPVLTSIILFEDFMSYRGGVYRYTYGRQLGSHAVVLIGWDDHKKAWIGRNSFGKDWGQNGYFYIAYDDRTMPGRYAWAFDLDLPQNYLTLAPANRSSQDVLSGTIAIDVKTNVQDAAEIEWSLSPIEDTPDHGISRRMAESQIMERSPIDEQKQFYIDSTQVENGYYHLQASIVHANGVTKSVMRRVAIMNEQPLLANLAFANLESGQTIFQRSQIQIAVDTTNVFFTSVKLIAKHLESGAIIEHLSENIDHAVLFNFAHRALVPGAYELQLVGEFGKFFSVESQPIQVQVL